MLQSSNKISSIMSSPRNLSFCSEGCNCWDEAHPRYGGKSQLHTFTATSRVWTKCLASKPSQVTIKWTMTELLLRNRSNFPVIAWKHMLSHACNSFIDHFLLYPGTVSPTSLNGKLVLILLVSGNSLNSLLDIPYYSRQNLVYPSYSSSTLDNPFESNIMWAQIVLLCFYSFSTNS